MIDSDPNASSYAEVGLWGRATLDALFKRNLARAPDRLALCDTSDRMFWSNRPAFRLSYKACEEIIAALASRFLELGLRQGSVVALEMPNCAEAMLTILACGRAGLVPAMLPLLWRAGDVSRTLEPLAAKALITVTRAGEESPADFLRYAAAELFTIRYVLAFGADAPDGVMSLDDCLNGQTSREARFPPPQDSPADQPALVTFATHQSGHVPIVRSHNHCVCAGLVNVLEANLDPGDVIASAVMPASLAALSASLFAWLLTGGTLMLHQPFDLDVFDQAIEQDKVQRIIVPGALLADLVPRLTQMSHRMLRTVTGIHADGTRDPTSQPLESKLDIVDVISFDEFGVAARRRQNGMRVALPVGPIYHPAGTDAGPMLLETRLGGDGTVLVRGPQVPYNNRYRDGYRPTTLRAKLGDSSLATLSRSAGVSFVGGLGVSAGEIENHLLASDELDAVKVITVQDPLFGQRIEAHIAPRLNGSTQNEAIVERIQARFKSAGLGPHKTPSRIIVDHRLRGDPHARQRSATR